MAHYLVYSELVDLLSSLLVVEESLVLLQGENMASLYDCYYFHYYYHCNT